VALNAVLRDQCKVAAWFGTDPRVRGSVPRVLDLRDQCERAGVAFFFKQWGGVRKHRTGRLLDGQTYDGAPAVLANAPPPRKRRLEWLGELVAKGAYSLISPKSPRVRTDPPSTAVQCHKDPIKKSQCHSVGDLIFKQQLHIDPVQELPPP
jgi:hypothetical protein